MANRYDNERRNERNRSYSRDYDRFDDRQQQQFESGNYGAERGYGQQGSYDDGYRQMDNDYGRDDFESYGRDDMTRRGGRDMNDRSGARTAGDPMRYDNRGDRFGSFNSNDYGGRDFERVQNRGYGSGSYGSGGGSYAGTMGHNRRRNEERGFFDKAGDEIASWFGDEDAERRRERDHTGRGPANYKRSDERILEDACDRLTDDWGVDASEITVTVQDAEVTLDGSVEDRRGKRRAEDCVHDISGVRHVQNNLRVTELDRRYDRTRTAEETSAS
ncbi:SWFGD domain-containing protein [uncultured Croceicoccus sp.]|uniref:BON domain-containing protein n=1 Tax=uncultured Croceicoccus sp. TaxID=1295329 RepID=UPI00262D2D36|nr:SWFGD domain-containing protein [uncultured Croceicoccus sp.]